MDFTKSSEEEFKNLLCDLLKVSQYRFDLNTFKVGWTKTTTCLRALKKQFNFVADVL